MKLRLLRTKTRRKKEHPVPYGGNLGKYCSLQSWLYRCIEDNEDWFMSLVSDDDISDMSE